MAVLHGAVAGVNNRQQNLFTHKKIIMTEKMPNHPEGLIEMVPKNFNSIAAADYTETVAFIKERLSFYEGKKDESERLLRLKNNFKQFFIP